MEFTQEDRNTLNNMAVLVGRIDERLGEDGKGLCGTVKEHERRLALQEKSTHRIYVALAFAAGCGGFSVGVISKLIGG